MRGMRCANTAWETVRAVRRKFASSVACAASAARPSSVNQNSRVERLGFFNRSKQAEKLIVVTAARRQASNFRLAQLTAQNQIEKIVVISGRLKRKFTGVRGCLAVFRSESRQQIEDVVGCETRGFTCKNDRNPQLKESQTVLGNHAPQLFCRFTIKRRFRIDQNAKQPWLIFFIERVERELDAVGEKLFKLRLNRVIDTAETAHRLTVAGGIQWQRRRAMSADDSGFLHALDFSTRIFHPL